MANKGATRTQLARVLRILSLAENNPSGISVKTAHEHLASEGIDCDYRTVVRDFRWLQAEEFITKQPNRLYGLAADGGHQ